MSRGGLYDGDKGGVVAIGAFARVSPIIEAQGKMLRASGVAPEVITQVSPDR